MHYTPLRYPGGKTKLAPLVRDIIIENDLIGGTYIEPYSGGAGVALTLLLENIVKNIVINDIDPVIYSFWNTLINEPEYLCKKILDTEINMDEWKKQRLINKNYQDFSEREIAFSTFFLNRTNRSGILLAGVIGGKNQTGNYKLNSRFNKKNLIKRIECIASQRNRIVVHNYDALELIDKVIIKTPLKVLYYFDPPYYNKGQCLYKNAYTHDDHEQVAKRISQLNKPWIVTYDNTPEIIKLYNRSKIYSFTINYCASKVMKASELLFFNNIVLPKNNKLILSS